MIDFKKCAEYIIDKEDCIDQGMSLKDPKEHYKNDEIEITGYHWRGDYSSFIVSFLDEESAEKKNKAYFIRNLDSSHRYVHIGFDLDDGEHKRIEIQDDNSIYFFSGTGSNVKCSRESEEGIYWFESKADNRGKFDLEEYGVDNFVDKIKEALKGGVEKPRFNRLFEIIRPVLKFCVLEIIIKEASLTYMWMKDNDKEIAEIDAKLANSQECEGYELYKLYKLWNKKYQLQDENERFAERAERLKAFAYEGYKPLYEEEERCK